MERARATLPGVELCDSPYAAVDGADAVVLVTEWDEFRALDLARIRRTMRTPVFVDGRNVFEPDRLRDLGFVYAGMGRGHVIGGAGPVSAVTPLTARGGVRVAAGE
jgi:UDPglucose 6-dehydrogenase